MPLDFPDDVLMYNLPLEPEERFSAVASLEPYLSQIGPPPPT